MILINIRTSLPLFYMTKALTQVGVVVIDQQTLVIYHKSCHRKKQEGSVIKNSAKKTQKSREFMQRVLLIRCINHHDTPGVLNWW